jgi:hypothetical protein
MQEGRKEGLNNRKEGCTSGNEGKKEEKKGGGGGCIFCIIISLLPEYVVLKYYYWLHILYYNIPTDGSCSTEIFLLVA